MKLYKKVGESYTEALGVDKIFHNDQYSTYGKDKRRHLKDKLVLPDNEVCYRDNSKVLYHRWVGSHSMCTSLMPASFTSTGTP